MTRIKLHAFYLAWNLREVYYKKKMICRDTSDDLDGHMQSVARTEYLMPQGKAQPTF